MLKLNTISILFLFTVTHFAQTNSKREMIPINIGFSIQLFNEVDIRDAEAAIQMWGNEFFGNLGINYFAATKIYQGEDELVKALSENTLDFVSLLTTEYFDIMKKVEIEPYFMVLGEEKSGINYILIVRKDKNIVNLNDLKNKDIIVQSGPYEKLVKIWIENILSDNRQRYNNFFSEINMVNKPSQALLPVFFKQKDACLILEQSYKSMMELNPQLKNELVIIEKSPELVGGIMCINKKVRENIKMIALETAQKLSKTASGKQILALFKAKEFVKYNPEYLKSTIDLYDKYIQNKRN